MQSLASQRMHASLQSKQKQSCMHKSESKVRSIDKIDNFCYDYYVNENSLPIQ